MQPVPNPLRPLKSSRIFALSEDALRDRDDHQALREHAQRLDRLADQIEREGNRNPHSRGTRAK